MKWLIKAYEQKAPQDDYSNVSQYSLEPHRAKTIPVLSLFHPTIGGTHIYRINMYLLSPCPTNFTRLDCLKKLTRDFASFSYLPQNKLTYNLTV